jgi:hypothetical protein
MKKVMKLFYFTLIFLLNVFLFSSCNQNSKKEKIETNENIEISDTESNKNLPVIDIDNIAKEKEIYYSSVFKKVKTIILETNEDCLIGSMDGMQALDDELFILDDLTNTLFMFNKDGHFIRKIGTPGNGPGEYIQICDFTIDPLKKEMYLLDSPGKIHKYNINTGEFINSIVLDNSGVTSQHIQYYENKLFLDAIPSAPLKDSYLLKEIDPVSGNQQKAFLHADIYNCGWNANLTKDGESFFYSRTYSRPKYIQMFMDTIVCIDKDRIFPFLAIKSKNRTNSKDIYDIKKYMEEHNRSYSFEILSEKNKIFDIRRFVECKNLILFDYIQGKDSYTVLYNTTERTARIANDFLDDLILSEGFFLQIFACADTNGIYSYISPGSMLLFVNMANTNQLAADLDKRNELMKLSEESNPVIFYYELR